MHRELTMYTQKNKYEYTRRRYLQEQQLKKLILVTWTAVHFVWIHTT